MSGRDLISGVNRADGGAESLIIYLHFTSFISFIPGVHSEQEQHFCCLFVLRVSRHYIVL